MHNENSNLGTVVVATVIVSLIVSGIAGAFGLGATGLRQKVDSLVAQVGLLDSRMQVSIKSGALAGPEIPSPFLQWGGVNHWAAGNVNGNTVGATTTSSVFCSIPVPYGTSTIERITYKPDSVTGIGTSAVFDVGTSTSMAATSSTALMRSLAINTAHTWRPIASSTTNTSILVNTASNGSNDVYTVVSTPTTPLFLNFKISTTSSDIVIPSTFLANCQAEFLQL